MSFAAFARACGVLIEHPRTDGRIHRCGTVAHPRSKNGAYAFDGARGWVQAWDQGDAVQWFNDPAAKPWTEAEKRAWMVRRAQERAEQARRHQQARERAAAILRAARMDMHGYLRLKGFAQQRGLVVDGYERYVRDGSRWSVAKQDAVLVIPMRSIHRNELQGLQAIYWTGEVWRKEMTPGMSAKGAVLRLGSPRARETILCEGFATGLSIEAAARQMCIDASVLICFSASNLLHVSKLVEGRAFVVADHDASGTGQGVAQASGLPYCLPPVEGWDANDWHLEAGLPALCGALMELRRAEVVM